MRWADFKISKQLLSYVVAVAAYAVPASAQTAAETIAYINGKIEGREVQDAEVGVRLGEFKILGSVLSFSYISTEKTFNATKIHTSEVDMTKLKTFTAFDIKFMLSNSDRISIFCDNSYGNCVKKTTCGDGCADKNIAEYPSISIELRPLRNDEEQKRVVKALIHLKSLFPTKKNIEMFDK